MKLVLKRQSRRPDATEGEIFLNGQHQCYTLEPGTDDGKGPIAAGSYPITITYSPHFGRDMPLLNHVPDFEGVRIHPGNTVGDTKGCILVGTYQELYRLDASGLAFALLFDKIRNAIDMHDLVTLEIQEAS